MSTATNTKIARCCHCRGMMRVTARALSVFCPHCHTRVTLEDLRIVGSHPGKRLATAGDILVEATARLNLELVGNRILIHGRIKGPVHASEYVEIGPTGQVVGDVHAPKLVVRDGGIMQGRFERLAISAPTDRTAPSEVVTIDAAEQPAVVVQEVSEPSTAGIRPMPLRPPPGA